jgi:Uncharacterised protein family (UPF0158)
MADEECRDAEIGASRCQVPIDWDALEAAFENTAPDIQSYLHLGTGEVVRVIAGGSDETMRKRLSADVNYRHVVPVPSRDQYRWMVRFIATVEKSSLRDGLSRSIDGKRAFRRFKEALRSDSVEHERWHAFRSERLRVCIEVWLDAQGVEAVERPAGHVPGAELVPQRARCELVLRHDSTEPRDAPEPSRASARRLVEALPARDLAVTCAFLAFLTERATVGVPREARNREDERDAARDSELDREA